MAKRVATYTTSVLVRTAVTIAFMLLPLSSLAAVQFAGLAPWFVGLYQVNVVVPTNIEPDSEVELSLTQNGVPSNTVTVAMQ